jgi:formylmethanofuran dehydrogenase subunit C
MFMRRIVTRTGIGSTGMAAGKRFGGYKNETERSIRESKAEDSGLLWSLGEAWHSLGPDWPPDKMYPAAMELIKGLRPDAESVERFCILMEGFRQESNFRAKAGIFISALINKGSYSERETYHIPTQQISQPVDYLGYRNRKKVIIEGDAGDQLGRMMEEGSIEVQGNAGVSVGEGLNAGTLTVHGDCGLALGQSMRGGRIIVHGDARGEVGLGMVAGEIDVRGQVGSVGRMETRQIYQGGVLIVDR